MNAGISESIATKPQHRIATNRSLDTLLSWSAEVLEEESIAGRKVIYAPCQALRGAVSLRSWILSRARRTLGDSAPDDMPTLLSGAADTLVIADPASADPGSLRWLGDLLACADSAGDIAATPPMPRIVLLIPTGTQNEPHVEALLGRLNSLGSKEERVPGRQGDPKAGEIDAEIGGLSAKYGDLMAALALMPCPLETDVLDALAKSAKAGSGAERALTGGTLFRVVGNFIVPTNAEVVQALRESFDDQALKSGAQLLLKIVKENLKDIPDAQVDIQLRAGDGRGAVTLARKRFSEHYDAGNFEEALRILRVARELGHTLETGKHAEVIDHAKLAALLAEVGENKEAEAIVSEFAKRRDLYRVHSFIEWVALAARTLAMRYGFEPRTADSLMRRAIRLVRKDTDHWVRLRLLRVELLRSSVFNLEDRADWLLSHVSNKILDKVSQPTLAAYLDEIATRLFNKGDYKGAFKRLRRLGTLPTSNERLGRAMLLMAKCREHFKDHEAAARYGNSALHYGMRAARPQIVEDAAKFLRRLEKERPRRLPRLTPPSKGRGTRPRLPAAADIPTPQSAEASQLFEILQARFNVTYWVRRRNGRAEFYGDQPGVETDNMSVYHETPEGTVTPVTHSGNDAGEVRGVALMRNDGDDMVVYTVRGESRDDAIVQFLLTDRGTGQSGEKSAPPARKAVVDEYMRRALDQGIVRGLHHTMETLFNKDVLIFFEEQGFSKEEMAEKLGVSRATLYRMYARAGLN